MGNSTRLRQQDGVGKQKRKVIDQGVAYPNQPIEIVELKVNGRAAQLSQGIDGDTDWLNGLSWKIKNLAKKNILSIDLFVPFPDTQSTGRLLVYPMHYGADPKIAKNPEIVKPVKSEDTADFVISSEVYGDIKPHLEARIPLSDVNHVRIKLELIVFDDDTAWGSGQEMRRDQNDPRRWIPIE